MKKTRTRPVAGEALASPPGATVQLPLPLLEILADTRTAFFGLCLEAGQEVLLKMMEVDADRKIVDRKISYQHTGTKTAAAVRIEVVRFDGMVVGDATNDIPAAQFVGIPGATGIGAYCRVSNISKSHARVTVCVRDSTRSCITAPRRRSAMRPDESRGRP